MNGKIDLNEYNISYPDLRILSTVLKGEKLDSTFIPTSIPFPEIADLVEILKEEPNIWINIKDKNYQKINYYITKCNELLDKIGVEDYEILRSDNEITEVEFSKLFMTKPISILFIIYLLLLRALFHSKIGEHYMEYEDIKNDQDDDQLPKDLKMALKNCYRANHLLSRYLNRINRPSTKSTNSNPNSYKIKDDYEIVYTFKLFIYSTLGNLFYKKYSYQKSYDYYCKTVNIIKYPKNHPIYTIDALMPILTNITNLDEEKIRKLDWNDQLSKVIISASYKQYVEMLTRKGKLVIEFGHFVESIKWFLSAITNFYEYYPIDETAKIETKPIDELINYINTVIWDDVVNKEYIFNQLSEIISTISDSLILINDDKKKSIPSPNNNYYDNKKNVLILIDILLRLLYVLAILRSDEDIKKEKQESIAKIFHIIKEQLQIIKTNINGSDPNNYEIINSIHEYNTLLYINEIYFIYYLALRPEEDKLKMYETLINKLFEKIKNNEIHNYIEECKSKKDILSKKTRAMLFQLIETVKLLENIDSIEKVREQFINNKHYNGMLKELYFDMMLEMSNFVKVKDRNKQYLLKPSNLHKKSKEEILPVITVLKRYNSANPLIPRPEVEHVRGGGYYLITPSKKGIIIDPGVGFINNFYNEGFTIADIDAIMITHAHIDHMDDFENILTLLFEYNDLNKKQNSKKKTNLKCIDLFLSSGATCKAMSLVSAENDYVNTIYSLNPSQKLFKEKLKVKVEIKEYDNVLDLRNEYKVKLTILPCKHNDILLDDFSVGLKFEFYNADEEQATPDAIIGFTSDTGFYPEIVEKYYNCDLLFCHLGDAYREELYYEHFIDDIQNCKIDDVESIKSNLELIKDKKRKLLDEKLNELNLETDEFDADKWSIYKKSTNICALYAKNHLAINGLYSLISEILKKRNGINLKDRYIVFAISEFPEELESRRVNIAKKIRKWMRRQYNPNTLKYEIINTDIGVRFLCGTKTTKGLEINGNDINNRIGIHCDICALQDIKEAEEYHPAKDMQFTCVKAEEERIESRCSKHKILYVNKFVSFTDYINRKLIT